MAKDCPKCRTVNSDVALACDCGYVFREQVRSASAKKLSAQADKLERLAEAPPAAAGADRTEAERALDELQSVALGHAPARGTRGKSGLNTEQRKIVSWTCTVIAIILALASVNDFGLAGFVGAIVVFALGRVVWAGRSSLPGSLD